MAIPRRLSAEGCPPIISNSGGRRCAVSNIRSSPPTATHHTPQITAFTLRAYGHGTRANSDEHVGALRGNGITAARDGGRRFGDALMFAWSKLAARSRPLAKITMMDCTSLHRDRSKRLSCPNPALYRAHPTLNWAYCAEDTDVPPRRAGKNGVSQERDGQPSIGGSHAFYVDGDGPPRSASPALEEPTRSGSHNLREQLGSRWGAVRCLEHSRSGSCEPHPLND